MTTDLKPDYAPYTSEPTKLLVEALQQLVESRDDLQDNDKVKELVRQFDELSQQPAPITDYITKKTDPANPEAGFTPRQMTVLLSAFELRRNSTDGEIIDVVAALKRAGYDKEAAAINGNAHEEVGDHQSRPHSSLFHISSAALGSRLCKHHIYNSEWPSALELFRLHCDKKYPQTYAEFDILMKAEGIQFPIELENIPYKEYIKEVSFNKIRWVVELCGTELYQYHQAMLESTPGYNPKSPNKLKPLAMDVFKLAEREASSAGSESFIAAYQKLLNAYMGATVDENSMYYSDYIDALAFAKEGEEKNWDADWVQQSKLCNKASAWADDKRNSHIWAAFHADESIGKDKGWEKDTESGHALDACELALGLKRKPGLMSNPEVLLVDDFTEILESTIKDMQLRNKHWVAAIERMEQIGKEDHARGEASIPLNPLPRELAQNLDRIASFRNKQMNVPYIWPRKPPGSISSDSYEEELEREAAKSGKPVLSFVERLERLPNIDYGKQKP